MRAFHFIEYAMACVVLQATESNLCYNEFNASFNTEHGRMALATLSASG